MEVLLEDMEEIMEEDLPIMKEIIEDLLPWIIILDHQFVVQMPWDNITDPEHQNGFKMSITTECETDLPITFVKNPQTGLFLHSRQELAVLNRLIGEVVVDMIFLLESTDFPEGQREWTRSSIQETQEWIVEGEIPEWSEQMRDRITSSHQGEAVGLGRSNEYIHHNLDWRIHLGLVLGRCWNLVMFPQGGLDRKSVV